MDVEFDEVRRSAVGGWEVSAVLDPALFNAVFVLVGVQPVKHVELRLRSYGEAAWLELRTGGAVNSAFLERIHRVPACTDAELLVNRLAGIAVTDDPARTILRMLGEDPRLRGLAVDAVRRLCALLATREVGQ